MKEEPSLELVLWLIFECLFTLVEYYIPSNFSLLRYIPVSSAEGHTLLSNNKEDPMLNMN